ncbi:MAG: hypothetical protein IJ892_14220 [Prevotella sp.]|nr:hypothetical protein [Prevotella sp.]
MERDFFQNGVDFLKKVNAKFLSQGLGLFQTASTRSDDVSDRSEYQQKMDAIEAEVEIRPQNVDESKKNR